MSENENNKKMSLDNTMSLESQDSAAVKTPCQEANAVSEKGKKNTFGRKV